MSVYRDRTGRLTDLDQRRCLSPDFRWQRRATRTLPSPCGASIDESETSAITDALADAPIYLADGHHRYETALQYREDQRSAAQPL